MSFIPASSSMRHALEHFEGVYPNEGVGIFLSAGGDEKDEFIPLPNRTQRDPKHNFEIDPIELIEAVDRFAVRNDVPAQDITRLFAGETFAPEGGDEASCGLRIVSLVHSHPSGRVGPSEADLEALRAMSRFGCRRGWVLARTSGDLGPGGQWVTGVLSSFDVNGERVRYSGELR